MLDVASRLIPYLSHDDCTRIQMGSNQIKQSIPLIDAEVPFTRSGFEEEYLEYSSYLYRAKDDGKIIYKDDNILIAKYNGGSGEVIKIDSLYGNREGFDKMLFTDFNVNDNFHKDEILAYHSSINKDGFLTLGCNLKTTYISNPYNYKDALIISESCANKMRTRSIHEETIDCEDTIPILWNDGKVSYEQGTYVKKAQKIFVIKERSPHNAMNIVSEGEEILAPVSGKLYYKLKIDEVVKTQNEEDYYNKLYKEELAKEELISSKIKEVYNMEDTKEALIANALINYYCPQLNKRRSGKAIILTYWIVEEAPLIRGCKLTNRHGNKGVIAKIYPDNKMPKDSNGEYADIVVNSMCITSRMNVGQLFELHINRANYNYTKKIVNSLLTIDDKIKKLYEMVSQVQPDYINEVFKDFIDKATEEEKIKFLESVKEHMITQIVQPPFTKFTYEDCLKFCKEYGKMDDDLKEEIEFDGEKIRASFGHIYWYRLEHEPNRKYFARSVGVYGKIGQPSRNNGNNKGAHRIGELETWALLAHQAYENLLELFVSKSDSISEGARMLKYLYDNMADKYTPFIQTPGILRVFKNFVNSAGYEMVNTEDVREDDLTFFKLHDGESTELNTTNKTVQSHANIIDTKIEDLFNIDKELLELTKD